MATVIRSGENGIADTDIDRLADGMKRLLADPMEARRLGQGGQRTALARFNIKRFAHDWDRAFNDMMRFRHERFVA
jgi:glycosyltransferase involved in cell wall biosynthesis